MTSAEQWALDLGSSPQLQGNFILTKHIYKDALFKEGHILSFMGHMFWGDTVQPRTVPHGWGMSDKVEGQAGNWLYQ